MRLAQEYNRPGNGGEARRRRPRVAISGGYKEYNHGLLIHNEAVRKGWPVFYINRSWNRSKIISTIKTNKIEWLIVYPAGIWRPEFIFSLTRYCKIVIWDNDGLSKGRNRNFEKMDGKPNIIITSVKGIADRFQDSGDVVKWVPQYYDSEYYKPTLPKDTEKIYDVVFMGTDDGDPKRTNWLARLDKLFKIKVCGRVQGFPEHFARGSEMADIYRQSKIAIDIMRGRTKPLPFQTSDRIYKAMGCGCFYLTFPIIDITDLFYPGVHLDIYNDTFEGLVEKIRYYLENGPERRKIAAAGEREILEKHTLSVRVKEYWSLMENYEGNGKSPNISKA